MNFFLCQAVFSLFYAATPSGFGLYAEELRHSARGMQTGVSGLCSFDTLLSQSAFNTKLSNLLG